MMTTTYKRRSINMDDATYKRGKLLAKSRTVSLSAILRILINEAYQAHAVDAARSLRKETRIAPPKVCGIPGERVSVY